MKVKELLKQLKGEYTSILPFHTDHRNALPFTQLGKDLSGLRGKAWDKAFGEKEVVEYELGDWQKTACWTMEEFSTGVGHYEMTRMLTIYFK